MNSVSFCVVVVEQGRNWTLTGTLPMHRILVDVPCYTAGTGAGAGEVF